MDAPSLTPSERREITDVDVRNNTLEVPSAMEIRGVDPDRHAVATGALCLIEGVVSTPYERDR